jgi:hypothetical protein
MAIAADGEVMALTMEAGIGRRVLMDRIRGTLLRRSRLIIRPLLMPILVIRWKVLILLLICVLMTAK